MIINYLINRLLLHWYIIQFWPYMYIYHDPGKNILRADGLIYQMLLWLSARYDFT
jgi:hypothetical protein